MDRDLSNLSASSACAAKLPPACAGPSRSGLAHSAEKVCWSIPGRAPVPVHRGQLLRVASIVAPPLAVAAGAGDSAAQNLEMIGEDVQ